MTETPSAPSEFDRRLVGDLIHIGGRSLQPVARLRGRMGSGGGQAGGGAGGMLRLEPVEAIVREADGAEFTLALADPTAQALRAMAGGAVAVAVVSIGLAVLARLLRRRQRS
jgi:hypothetical protein